MQDDADAIHRDAMRHQVTFFRLQRARCHADVSQACPCIITLRVEPPQPQADHRSCSH